MVKSRRKYVRMKQHVRIKCHKQSLFFLKGPVEVAELADLSRSGARINTKAALAKGDSVGLMIATPNVIGQDVEFKGKVMWVKSVLQEGRRFFQIGVEFGALGAEQVALLARVIG